LLKKRKYLVIVVGLLLLYSKLGSRSESLKLFYSREYGSA